MEPDRSPELPRFNSEEEGWAEASERNRVLGRDREWKLSDYWKPDRYWIAVELPSGDWTIAESTGPDQTRRQRFRRALGQIVDPFNGSWGP